MINIFDKTALLVESIETSIQNKSVEIAFEKSPFIEKAQIKQIDNSINAQGQEITPRYTSATKLKKIKIGRSGKVDLRDKGDFLSEVTTDFINNEIHIGSTDSKNRFLEPRYNPFGLIEENINKLRGLVFPDLGKWVRLKLGLA